MKSGKFTYKCTDCGKEYPGDDLIYLCPSCSKTNIPGRPRKGILKTIYDYQHIRQSFRNFNLLKEKGFIDLLPLESTDSLPKLRIGSTPLYSIEVQDKKDNYFHLHLKDDSQNPTFSFKDRASALVSAYARENNLNTIVAASTGNAGSSLAGICASQGQKAYIMVPENAPQAKLTQIVMYGAVIIPVRGTYDDAFELSLKATDEYGWYNRNTAYNPLTTEGKKSVSYELFEQLHYRVPDRIFVPVGDGVIISGVYKGFEDLLLLGITDKMPVIVAVQSSGSNNLIRNLKNEEFSSVSSKTIADSISVDIPSNFFMTRQYLQSYNGETISVTDDDILNASAILSGSTGLFAEPAAAAAFAGLLSYKGQGKIGDNSDNVVLLTGSGLKDTAAVRKLIIIPEAVSPSIENLKKFL